MVKTEKYPETDSAKLQFTLIYSGKNVDKIQLKNWLRKRPNENNVELIQNSSD